MITIKPRVDDAYPVEAVLQDRPRTIPAVIAGSMRIDEAELRSLVDPTAYGAYLGDALLRGAIRDAHDRFANIEVGFLLQRIERFPGLVILASNLRKNIDAAFLRRLQVIVEFPAPDVASRARIWRQVWPTAAPVDPGVDPVLLAERFDLSGGHIRNIALAAAYAAAHEGATISLRHVLDAARAEYRKLDKLVREDSFADAPTTANAPR